MRFCDVATVLEVISVHFTVHPRLIAAFLQPIELEAIFNLACSLRSMPKLQPQRSRLAVNVILISDVSCLAHPQRKVKANCVFG